MAYFGSLCLVVSFLDHCGLFWFVLALCGPPWLIVAYFSSLWLVVSHFG